MTVNAHGTNPQEGDIDSTDVFYLHLKLKDVVVTGATGETRLKNSSAPVGVLSARDLQSVSSTNIVDAVATMPGFSQITTGGGISKPVIRGLGYNRVAVIVDGIRQEGQQWGDEHGLEVDGQAVGSVEVLKGPASLVYGSDAMAGVLKLNAMPNIAMGKMLLGVNSEYQTNNGLAAYSLNYAGNKSGFVWDLRYSEKYAHEYKNHRDGYVPNTQFGERAFRAKLGLNRNWGKSIFTVSHYGITPSIAEGERDETTGALEVPYDKLKQYSHGIPFQKVYHDKLVTDNMFYFGQNRLQVLVGWQQNRRKEYEEEDGEVECGLHMRLRTLNYSVNYFQNQFEGWKITGGIGGMFSRSLNRGDEYLIPDYKSRDFGTFVTVSHDEGKLSFSAGVRYDNRHIDSEELIDDGDIRFAAFERNFDGLTGSAGLVYHFDDNLSAKFNMSRGFRAPGISELASNGVHEGSLRYEIGNNTLKPEFSWQYDLGLDYSGEVVQIGLSLFLNRISNYIFLHRVADVVEPPYMTFRYDSGSARLMGGEVSVDVHPLHCLHLGTAFSMVDAIQLHQPIATKYLPFTPAPRWQADVKYEINHHGKFFCNSYVSAGIDCYFKQNHYYRADDTETATPAYTLLKMAVGSDINIGGTHVAVVQIIGDNLLNTVYQSHLSRLKYAPLNPVTGNRGIYNMGRNITFKLSIPLEL
ncbi:MAG: TonB-dependent receptor [Muribaculaceae bacterium]|nr:TonB-dependent receptor [Muribaculaceae bacterium]